MEPSCTEVREDLPVLLINSKFRQWAEVDRRPKKGKRARKSTGKSRPSKRAQRVAVAKKATAKKATKKAPKSHTKKAAPKKAAVKKAAAKKK